MGLGSILAGVAIGAGAVFVILKQETEAEVPPEPVIPPFPQEDFINVSVQPVQIDADRWQFEADYFNRSNMQLKLDVVFEVTDPQGLRVFAQRKAITINPGSTIQVFWDTGNLTSLSLLTGDFIAIFTTEERGTFDSLSRPETVIFPVA